jgi:alkylmercury lyase-like protein
LLNTDRDEFDRAVRQAVYDHTLRAGRPPTCAEAAAALSAPQTDLLSAFQRLAAAHVLVLQPESGEILMAAPFSAVPTPFPIATPSQNYYGNCIWDALGAIAMLGPAGQPAVIRTACPDCGEALDVTVREGHAMAPPSLIHFALRAARWWDDIVFT